MTRVIYVNGRYLPWGEASVHAEDRGFQFADAVYEVCEVRGGAIVDEGRHLARLDRSLKELACPAPMSLALLGGTNIGAVSTAPEHLGLRDDYGGQRLARISGAALDGTAVVVDEVYDATGEEPNCCLTGQATMRWTWNGRWEATVVGG